MIRGVVLIQFIVYALATEFFVSPNGNDSNAGSFALPWKTLTKSIPLLQPGDILNLRSGIYKENGINIQNAGSAGMEITIRGYPEDPNQPIIDGSILNHFPNNS